MSWVGGGSVVGSGILNLDSQSEREGYLPRFAGEWKSSVDVRKSNYASLSQILTMQKKKDSSFFSCAPCNEIIKRGLNVRTRVCMFMGLASSQSLHRAKLTHDTHSQSIFVHGRLSPNTILRRDEI